MKEKVSPTTEDAPEFIRGWRGWANKTKGGNKNGKVSNTLGDGYDQSI